MLGPRAKKLKLETGVTFVSLLLGLLFNEFTFVFSQISDTETAIVKGFFYPEGLQQKIRRLHSEPETDKSQNRNSEKFWVDNS